MFFIINLFLIAAAGLLVLLLASTASFPRHDQDDLESPEGEWVGRTRLPARKAMTVRSPMRKVRLANMAKLQAADAQRWN